MFYVLEGVLDGGVVCLNPSTAVGVPTLLFFCPTLAVKDFSYSSRGSVCIPRSAAA